MPDVVLVSLPWPELSLPSIQLGILKGVLDRAGISCDTAHLFVDFADWATRHADVAFDLQTYREISSRAVDGIGDWIFCVEPYRQVSESEEARYLDFCRSNGDSDSFIALARSLRRIVPSFLGNSADRILAKQPKVVGFTTTFAQNVPSLVLSRMLKLRDPSLKVIFGGANCESDMGVALHRLHDWVDVVVRGQAEASLPRLARDPHARHQVSSFAM